MLVFAARQSILCIAFSIFTFSSKIWAENCLEVEAERMGMNDPALYRPGVCASNVKAMLTNFAKNGGSVEKASVILVLHEMVRVAGGPTMPTKLLPQRMRTELTGQGRTFEFHTFVELEGHIYDLDFAGQATERSVYVMQMFDRSNAREPAPEALSAIQFVSIPAGEYLATWNRFESQIPEGQRFRGEEWVRGNVVKFFREQSGKSLPIRKLSEWAPSKL